MEQIKTGDWDFDEEPIKAEEAEEGAEEVSSAEEPLEEEAEEVKEVEGRDPREEKLSQILKELLESSPYIEAAALVSFDGLILASALPEGAEEDRVAAMSAAILSLGEKAASELGRGNLSQVFVEGDDGYVFLMSAAKKAVLVAIASKNAKLGLAFYDLKKTAESVGEVL